MRLSLLLALALLCATRAANAEPARVELEHDWSADLFVTASGAYLDFMFELELNPSIAPRECHWCKPPEIDAKVRKALVWKNPSQAGTLGSVAGFVVTPIAAVGLTSLAASLDDRGDEAPLDALLIAESVTTAIAITEIAKPVFGRARPAVYYRDHDWERFSDREQNVSFFSGHSSTAFSLAVSAGTISSMREYRLAPAVWAVGLPLAAFTAYSRIAADAHYLSDVVVGSLVGAGIGFAVPYVFHPPVRKATAVSWQPLLSPLPGGALIGVAGTN